MHNFYFYFGGNFFVKVLLNNSHSAPYIRALPTCLSMSLGHTVRFYVRFYYVTKGLMAHFELDELIEGQSEGPTFLKCERPLT